MSTPVDRPVKILVVGNELTIFADREREIQTIINRMPEAKSQRQGVSDKITRGDESLEKIGQAFDIMLRMYLEKL